MIKITIELVSSIDRSRDRLLGVGLISNVGVTPEFRGDYEVWLSKWAPRERQAWKTGRLVSIDAAELIDGLEGDVTNFDRDRRGAWDLLYLALRLLVGSRNP